MTDQHQDNSTGPDSDSWLSAVFAAATGPVVDMAFVDRVLSRMRRRQQVRSLVITLTVVFAGVITLWQLSGLAATVPVFENTVISAPEWLTANPVSTGALALVLVALTAWMITEEA